MKKKNREEFDEFFKDEGLRFKGSFEWLMDLLAGYYICRFCANNMERSVLAGLEEGIGLPTFCKCHRYIRLSEVKYHIRSCKKFVPSAAVSKPPSRARYLGRRMVGPILLVLFLLLIAYLSK